MAKVVAVTGGIASGKSTVCDEFKKLGVPIIDTDEIAKALVAKGQSAYNQVVSHFGEKILLASKEINRAMLREQIFQQPEQKTWLETLLHPLIRTEVKRRIKLINEPYCIIVVPLLAEHFDDYKDFVDHVICVDVPKSVQLERLITRDGISREMAEQMISQQASREQREAIADTYISGNMPKTVLSTFIINLHQSILTSIKT